MIRLFVSKDIPNCQSCLLAEKMLKLYGINFTVVKMDELKWDQMIKFTHKKSVPYIFTRKGDFIGGYEDLQRWLALSFEVKYYSKHDLESITHALHKKHGIDYRIFLHSFLKCLNMKYLKEIDTLQQSQSQSHSHFMMCDKNGCYMT